MDTTTSVKEDKSKRLDRAVIVKAGLEIAARPQNNAVSVRALGTELGVDPTAIYRHFTSKDDLMRALLDELQSAALNRVSMSSSWRERLRDLAWATLEIGIEYPAVALESTVLSTNGPAEMESIEFILAALSEAGLEGTALVHHYALFSSYVLSEVAGFARGRSVSGGATDETDGWFDGPLLVDPSKHVHIAAVASELRELRDGDIFKLGIELILDSVARTASHETNQP
ncbi:TetR/AcrR family transcriptional regulator [Salinibacterium sp. NG253]|uniref:TetR/AcrR family transcriptional regulator n=1 Tax=Salinibacterium sp. NG253 TaxID=2792039 RepID=UPI0018CD08FA|nr:TetR/AcrR family transcriptional regulator [Salinibacterium sp. NG253]MBH0116692.1 TetR/AcrR family transcriptional regulator [Salinibacterium sp. NG253]